MAVAKDLTEFLMNRYGGKKAVMSEFYAQKMKDMIANGATIAEIISVSKKEKWYSIAATMNLADVMGLKATKKKATKIKGKKAPKRAARLSSADKEKMVAGIVTYLKKNPWAGKGAIASAVKFDAAKVGPQVIALKKAGKIKSSGKKATMVYAVKGEKKKAPR